MAMEYLTGAAQHGLWVPLAEDRSPRRTFFEHTAEAPNMRFPATTQALRKQVWDDAGACKLPGLEECV